MPQLETSLLFTSLSFLYSKFSLFSLQEGRVSDILETGSAGIFIGNVLSQAVPWLLGFDIQFTIYK